MKVSAFSCLRIVRLFASSFQLRRSILPAVLCALVALLVCPLVHAQSAAYSGVERTLYNPQGASPMGVAVDSLGNVYIADAANHAVLEMTPSGTGFNAPTILRPAIDDGFTPVAVAVDALFNVYIADGGNHRVLKENWSGSAYTTETVVTTNLTSPTGLTVDASQDIYIVDEGAQAILLEEWTAGSPGTYTRIPLETINLARILDNPIGIAVDGSRNLYITNNDGGDLIQANWLGGALDHYSPTVTSMAGADPGGIAIWPGSSKNLYITGYGSNAHEPLYLETASGSGSPYTYAESDVATTDLAGSTGVAIDTNGNIYIADTGHGRVIEEMRATAANLGAVAVGSASAPVTMLFAFYGESTVTGISPVVLTQGATGLDFQIVPSGSTGAGGTCAWNGTGYIYNPSSADSRYLFCSVNLTLTPAFPGARYGAVALQQISDPTLTVATAFAYGNGLGPQVIFTNPLPALALVDSENITTAQEIASDSAGNVYFSVSGMGVYKYNGISVITVTTACGHPHGVAVDGAGNVYIADTSGSQVLKETLLPSGLYTETQLVGSLSSPKGVAVDGAGNVYIANTGGNTVVKETLQSDGTYSQSTVASSLGAPQGVVVDGAGNVYIANTGAGTVLELTPTGEGYNDPITMLTGLNIPTAVAVDGAGNVFIAETGAVLMELPNGDGYTATTLASGDAVVFTGVAVDGAGDVFYATGGAINELPMSTPPSFSFADTHVGFPSVSQSGSIANVGTTALSFPVPNTGYNPSVDADYIVGGSCPIVAAGGSPLSLTAGTACSFTVIFSPTTESSYPSARSTDIIATDNNLNVPNVTQSIPLSGNALAPPETTATSITFTPGPVMDVGQTVTISGTVTGTVTPTGMVVITDTYNDNPPVTLSSCVALSSGAYTFNYGPLVGTGTHVITVTYLPGGNNELYQTSSNTANLTVQPAGTTTTTLVVARSSAASTPVTWVQTGTPITLTATVVAGSTPLSPGVVVFCDAALPICTDVHLVGTAQLTSAGIATITFTPGDTGHSYTAVFVPETNYLPSVSCTRHLWVGGIPPNLPPYATTTTFTSTGTDPYTLTATVTGMGSMILPVTGTVTFEDSSNDNWVLGTATLGASTLALDFENPANPTGGNYAVAAGDFNGDGKLDLALTNTNHTLYIYFGNGDGTFAAGPSYTVGNGAQSIVVGDFNNDGKPDLATANYVDGTVTVLTNNGGNPVTFTVADVSPIVGSGPTAIVTGDFNGDGNADLAVANGADNTVTILLGNGSGAFSAGSAPATGEHPVSLVVGDFNNDGHLDLATANATAKTVTLLLNNGTGTFAPTVVGATGNGPTSIATADLRRNGTLDLLVTNSIDNTVTVLLNNGGEEVGTFTPVASPITGQNPRSIAIGDFNHDHRDDLAITNANDNTVTVLMGNGDGTFTATGTSPSTGPANSAPQGIAIGDFNGDGFPDVAASNANTGITAVLVLHPELSTETATATREDAHLYGTGLHNVVASYSGETGDGPLYSPSGSDSTALTALLKTTTLTVSANLDGSTYGQSVILTATLCPYTAADNSSNGETVTFYNGVTAIGTGTLSSGVATLTLSSLPAGTLGLSASYTADSYLAASASSSYPFIVAPAPPTIAFTVAPKTFGAAPFTVSASSASSGAFTYALVSGPATVTGNTVTITGAGTVILSATQAAAGNYATASQNTSFLVGVETPTIAFTVAPKTFGAAPFTVSASSASSGAFTYALVLGPATVTGNTVAITGAGTVVLSATQAAAGNYATASENASFTVATETPTIAFTVANHTFGGAPFTVSASSASSGAFTYAVVSGPATVTGDTVTVTGAGTVVLSATQTAAGNYAAGSQNASFTSGVETPTIAFSVASQTYGAAPFTVSASSASSGAFTYALVSGPAAITGNTVTVTGVGTVVLSASQAAAGSYAAGSQNTSFTVGAETPLLTFATIALQTTNSVPFSVSASSASAGAVTYAVVSGPATIVGSTVTLTGTGTVVLSAAQAAAGNYTAASTTTSFTVDSGFTLGLASGPSSTSGSATTTPGGAATFGLILNPGTGATFPDAVTFTAFGLPSGATASFSPDTIPAGSGPTTVTLTIQTPSTLAAMGERPFPVEPLGPLALGLLLPLVGVRRARRWMRQLRYSAVAVLTLLGVMAALGGCAGAPSTPATQNTTTQSYAVVVTATDTVTGARTTANVNLIVQ